MNLELWITIEEIDQNGIIISRHHAKCHSLVQNFIDLLYVQMSQASITTNDINGVSRSPAPYSYSLDVVAAVNTSTYGIRVGTGNAAVTIGDYTLGTLITHGTGAGQLSHGAVSVTAPGTVGSSREFTISRTFTNNTASPITVNEIGLAGRSVGSYPFLLDRTLNTFTINAGASKTVTYTIKVTV